MVKKIFLGCGGLFVLFIILMIVVAMFGASKGPSKVGSSDSNSANPTKLSEFKVGDTISIKDQTLKVTSADINYVPSNEFERAKAGHQLVLVNVTIHNNGSSSVDFNPFDFKIQDSQGAQTTETIVGQTSNALSSGTLAANGTASGDIVFDVKSENASKLKLLFTAGFWDQQTVTITLN